MPDFFESFFDLAVKNHRSIAMPTATKESMINFEAKGTGVMRADVPTTKRILKMLDPTIFPIAMSEFPFLAANMDVTSSGNEVPRATIVRPINRWLMPKCKAKLVAPSTAKLLPSNRQTRPKGIKTMFVFLGVTSSVVC